MMPFLYLGRIISKLGNEHCKPTGQNIFYPCREGVYILHCYIRYCTPVQQGRARLQFVAYVLLSIYKPSLRTALLREDFLCVVRKKHKLSFSHAVLPSGNKAFWRANRVCHVLNVVLCQLVMQPASIQSSTCLQILVTQCALN